MAKRKKQRKTPKAVLQKAGLEVRESARMFAAVSENSSYPTVIVDAAAELIVAIRRALKLRRIEERFVVAEVKKRGIR